MNKQQTHTYLPNPLSALHGFCEVTAGPRVLLTMKEKRVAREGVRGQSEAAYDAGLAPVAATSSATRVTRRLRGVRGCRRIHASAGGWPGVQEVARVR